VVAAVVRAATHEASWMSARGQALAPPPMLLVAVAE
jgi:hypothetical protein